MAELEVPNFGELLAPFIAQAGEDMPSFLAMLERGAADRYRHWAQQMPEHSEGLRSCAAREDEIADTVDALFPIDDVRRAEVAKPLPAARELYYSVFADIELHQQLAIQANAERQGAAAWRGMLDGIDDVEVRARLEHCALLEETSADYLDVLLAGQK